MKDIHKGGRPEVYDKKFYMDLLKDYESMSYSMLAKKYNKTQSTVARWLRKARELQNEKQG